MNRPEVMVVAEGFMAEFDAPVKYSVICLCAYIVFLSAMPRNVNRRQCVVGGLLALVPAMWMTLLRDFLIPFHVVSMVAVFMLVMWLFFKLPVKETASLTMVSFGFSYAAFFISTLVVIVTGGVYCETMLGDYRIADIFFESAVIHVVTVLIMQAIYIAIICLVMRSKRLRNGLVNIVTLGTSDVGIYMSVIILLSTTLYGVLYLFHINDISSWVILFMLLVCILSMAFWVKREIKAAYIYNKMNDENELLQKCLDEKDRLIAELREDNERLAGVIHKDNKLIPAMVMSVKRCVSGIDERSQDISQSAANALALAEQLEEIYGERAAALLCCESRAEPFPSTGVTSVDAILYYMARQAEKREIAFDVEVSDDVKELLDHTIERREFNTILADLVENALIAAQTSEAKAVSVEIEGEGDGCFLRVSDSGGAFDKEVLDNMGRRKMTTRADKGGSGTGLMNLSNVLKKYGAGFSIVQCPSGSRYTKSLTVTFNGKGQ